MKFKKKVLVEALSALLYNLKIKGSSSLTTKCKELLMGHNVRNGLNNALFFSLKNLLRNEKRK